MNYTRAKVEWEKSENAIPYGKPYLGREHFVSF